MKRTSTMKQLTTCVLSILLGMSCFSQDELNYFWKPYVVADTSSSGAFSTVVVDDGYLSLISYDGLSTIPAIHLWKSSLAGDSIWSKTLDNEEGIYGIVVGTTMKLTSDNHLAITYSQNKPGTANDLDCVLLKVTLEGEVLWKQKYGTSDQREGPHEVIECADGGFFLAGLQQYSGQPASYYCVRTDEMGEVLWTNTYTLGGNSVAFHCVELLNGNFVITGYGQHPGADYDSYVVSIDSGGELLWEQTLGENGDDTGSTILNEPKIQLILSYDIDKNEFGESINIGHRFSELDLDTGEVLWESTIPAVDTSLVTTGKDLELEHYYFGGAYSSEAGHVQPVFSKFTREGERLFTKYLPFDPNSTLQMRDLDATADGGFIFTGFRAAPWPQYGFIAKIDSLGNGCFSLGCDSVVTSVATQDLNRSLYQSSVYPNPCRGHFVLQYELPYEYPTATLKLTDQHGRLVLTQRLHTLDREARVSLEGLAAGAYFYQILLRGQVVSGGKVFCGE